MPMHQAMKYIFATLLALLVAFWLSSQQAQSRAQDDELAAISSRLDSLAAQTDSIQSMLDNRERC